MIDGPGVSVSAQLEHQKKALQTTNLQRTHLSAFIRGVWSHLLFISELETPQVQVRAYSKTCKNVDF